MITTHLRLIISETVQTTVFDLMYLFITAYFNCKWGSTRWQWYYNKTQHNNNTHHKKQQRTRYTQ
jgi:hypothetical protein